MNKQNIGNDKKSRRSKINLVCMVIAGLLLVLGIVCILIKGMTPEYLDEQGFLQESFFLLPIGFFFIFSGIITFIVVGICNIVATVKKQKYLE